MARRLRRERNRRTKKLLIIGLVVIFFLYCMLWYLLTRGTADDPVFQLRKFFEQMWGEDTGTTDDIPWPPALDTHKKNLTQRDKATFTRALMHLQRTNEPRKAGRELWPLASNYPELRPSIAREYYDQARLLRLQKPKEALKLIQMALAFNGKGIRENMLASEIYSNVKNDEAARLHRQLAAKYFKLWRDATRPPPNTMVTFFLFFIVALIGTAAYYYWDELNLVERVQVLLQNMKKGKVPDFSKTSPGMPYVGTSPGEVILPGSAPPQAAAAAGPAAAAGDKGSITGILQAEGFLKEVQDFFDQKNYELAVDLCSKAVELNPANAAKVASLCFKEGVSLYDIGDFDRAIDLLEVSLHFAPHTVQAHLCLGNCYIKLGAYDKAQHHYEQVISITPQNTDAYYTLGVCYQKTNNLAKARRSFEVAVKLKDHPNSHFYLAKICEKDSDLDGAIHHWQKFIELAPDNPQAPSAKKRLEALMAQRGPS